MTAPPLLDIRDLSVSFRSRTRVTEAVKNVSFQVNRGEVVALVGESGSGKSVTALSVLQLLPYPTAFHSSGSIRFKGAEMVGAEERALRGVRGNDVTMIFQEPMSSLNPLHTIRRQIGEILGLHKGLGGAAAEARILELLDRVHIRNAKARLNAFPHELSGGQRQRVMIAMALANEPDLLIADEPTTALDVTIQAQILELLNELRRDLGMAILMITHDLGIVRTFAERVCVMKQGVIVEQGETARLFDRPNHVHTRELTQAEPHGQPHVARTPAETLLTAENVRVRFPIKKGLMKRTVDHVRAVDGVSLELRRGHTLGVVGESGSGKTTLGMALLRLGPSQGAVTFEGAPIHAFDFRRMRPLRRRMSVVFQDPFGSLSPRMSIAQIIEEGLIVHKMGDRAERERMIVAIMQEVDLDPETRQRYPHEFSGGQRQRVAIARAMVLRPDLVVLDEPTSALDVSVQAQIVALLRRLQDRHHLAYLFISHDLRVVRALSHEVMVLRQGRVVEQGPAQALFEAPTHPYTKALMRAAFDLKADDSGVVSE